MANWPAALYMLRGVNVADVPIIVAANDPCMSCTDRMAVLVEEKGNERIWTWEELRQYGIDHYRKKGIRF